MLMQCVLPVQLWPTNPCRISDVLLWQPVESISGRSAGFILSSSPQWPFSLCAPFAESEFLYVWWLDVDSVILKTLRPMFTPLSTADHYCFKTYLNFRCKQGIFLHPTRFCVRKHKSVMYRGVCDVQMSVLCIWYLFSDVCSCA